MRATKQEEATLQLEVSQVLERYKGAVKELVAALTVMTKANHALAKASAGYLDGEEDSSEEGLRDTITVSNKLVAQVVEAFDINLEEPEPEAEVPNPAPHEV